MRKVTKEYQGETTAIHKYEKTLTENLVDWGTELSGSSLIEVPDGITCTYREGHHRRANQRDELLHQHRLYGLIDVTHHGTGWKGDQDRLRHMKGNLMCQLCPIDGRAYIKAP